MPELPVIMPPHLEKGDTVAMLAPASAVCRDFVEGARHRLLDLGLKVHVYPSAYGEYGSYSAPVMERVAELTDAILNPQMRAILCARGGYGCIHLLPFLMHDMLRLNPKWLIGFSDISALHAYWSKSGIMSMHASMARWLASTSSDDASMRSFVNILMHNRIQSITTPSGPFWRPGRGTGRLLGGNLAVLNSLAATPHDILAMADDEPVILFLEDVSEAIYAVERMLLRLTLSGTLRRVKGLILGQFTEYKRDRNFATMEHMIGAHVLPHIPAGIPVVTRFPVGHVVTNMPMVESATYTLEVIDADTTVLTPAPAQ